MNHFEPFFYAFVKCFFDQTTQKRWMLNGFFWVCMVPWRSVGSISVPAGLQVWTETIGKTKQNISVEPTGNGQKYRKKTKMIDVYSQTQTVSIIFSTVLLTCFINCGSILILTVWVLLYLQISDNGVFSIISDNGVLFNTIVLKNHRVDDEFV